MMLNKNDVQNCKAIGLIIKMDLTELGIINKNACIT
jgi:hypothetical protein